MVEVHIRLTHHTTSHCAQQLDEGDLASIQKDEYKLNFGKIGEETDAAFNLEGLLQGFLNDVTRSALHSYTHSGLLQLGRHFDGNDIKPNYSDDEIVEVIRVTTSALSWSRIY